LGRCRASDPCGWRAAEAAGAPPPTGFLARRPALPVAEAHDDRQRQAWSVEPSPLAGIEIELRAGMKWMDGSPVT